MSRAMRRQQMIAKPPAKAPSFKPSGARPQKQQVSAEAAAEARKRRTFLERVPVLGRAIQDIINELKKVTWPAREEVTRLTIAVVVVSVAMGLFLGGVDLGFNWLVENTLLR
jgi:preprotein translocase subunit SecE